MGHWYQLGLVLSGQCSDRSSLALRVQNREKREVGQREVGQANALTGLVSGSVRECQGVGVREWVILALVTTNEPTKCVFWLAKMKRKFVLWSTSFQT